jgi:hypothetical protein
MKKIVLVLMYLVPMFGFLVMSCGTNSDSSSGTDPLGGEMSVMGEPGNTFDIPGFSGTTERTAEVITRDGNVSLIRASAKVTNPNLLNIVQELDVEGLEVNGDRVTYDLKARITSQGIQNVSHDNSRSLTLVDYDAKVGDSYKGKISLGEVTRNVTKVSSEDDFFWGFMYIKTIEVEERNQIPGVSKVVYHTNHRFGLVAADVYYEDGSTMMTYVFSDY